MMSNYKNYILMDNFRGFSKTVVPISKTNFLVGENSTGKSSVLSLLKILSNTEFWQKCELKCNEINLGHAHDVISAAAEDKSFFRVGYLSDGKQDEGDKNDDYLLGYSFLITYSNNSGVLTPKIITLFDKREFFFSIKIMPNSIYLKVDNKENFVINDLDSAQQIFLQLINIHEESKGFSKLNVKFKDIPDFRSLIFISLLEFDKKSKVDSYSYISHLLSGNKIKWVAPIRSKPRRTYDDPTEDFSPEGDHTPYLLRSLSSKNKDVIRVIEETGRNSGLFNKITFIKYGRGKNSPFELDVMLDNNPINIINVGYGVSQSIPIIAEIASSQDKSWLIVQQPEVHLHPKAQAGIGDIVFDASSKWSHTLMIETHSDFMIDRFRIRRRKEYENGKRENVFSSQILFFKRENGLNTVIPIEIKSNGDVSENQPAEYRDFFVQEQLEILGI